VIAGVKPVGVLVVYSAVSNQGPRAGGETRAGDRTAPQGVADQDAVDDEGDAQGVSQQPQRETGRAARRRSVHVA